MDRVQVDWRIPFARFVKKQIVYYAAGHLNEYAEDPRGALVEFWIRAISVFHSCGRR